MNRKRISVVAYLTFLVMGLMSLLYYKERTVFIDIAYHLFHILKNGDFAIQNNRFGAFFTQLFPLLGAKSGCSLEHITQAYSLSFVLLPLLTFTLISQVLKNTRIGLAYLLSLLLITTHTFYWIQSELPQGMAFLFLFFALLDNAVGKEKVPPGFVLFSLLLIPTIVFTHPLLICAFFPLLLFYFFTYREKRKIFVLTGLFYVAVYAAKATFFKTPYDTEAMAGLGNIRQLFPHYINLQSNKNFVHYCIRDYYFLLIILAANTLYYCHKRSWFKLLVMLSAFGAYLFIVNLTYPGGAVQFYIENQYLILALIVAFPFAYDVLPQIADVRLQTVLVALVCTAGLLRMYRTHDLYAARLQWNRQLLEQTASLPEKKLIVPVSVPMPMDTLFMSWASSYELWLLSTLESGESRSVIIEERPGEFDWGLSEKKALLTKWGGIPYSELPAPYFRFYDTSAYVVYKP